MATNGRNIRFTEPNEFARMETSGHFVCRAHFFYDQSGKVAKATYNSGHFTFLYNMQGDVVGIVDSVGTEVVKYTYDAWGRLLSKTGTMASTFGTLNPFRYRGYVYDEETGLYYLRSRYYNPTWGRFVNADSLVGKVGVLLSHNCFAYCQNSPSSFFESYFHSIL